jgi:hypothetical protein
MNLTLANFNDMLSNLLSDLCPAWTRHHLLQLVQGWHPLHPRNVPQNWRGLTTFMAGEGGTGSVSTATLDSDTTKACNF